MRNETVFCARDHFGVKPFYYYRSDRALVVASEIKALLCVPGVPCRLNEVRVGDYLLAMLEDKESTFYQGILRLPPGHSLTLSRTGACLRRYWTLDPTRDIRYASDDEYAAAFRELFTEAVRCRVRSAFPVGSLLSGGLDSSSVVCVARQLLQQSTRQPLHTFSATFEGRPQCDEREFIDAVASQRGLQPHRVRCDQLSPLTDFDNLLWQQDEAFFAPNLFMHQALCRLAKDQGVRVLLDGIDGDTTVSHGIVRLAELLAAGNLRSLAKEVSGLSRHFNRTRRSLLWSYALRPLVPQFARRAVRVLRGRSQPVRTANPTINEEFARRIDLAERIRTLSTERCPPARTSRDDQWRRLTSGGYPFVFEVSDKAAAAFSLELRHPFFDKRLVEFCLGLPPEQKLRNGWTRVIMRDALTDTVPDSVRWRGGKTYLGANFAGALLEFEQPQLAAFTMKPPAIMKTYLDSAALRKVYNRYVSQKKEADALTVWKAVTLGKWLDGTGLTP